MSAHGDRRLWIAQRATAAVLAFCVVVHLATIIYAVHAGLSAAQILARTRASLAWGCFYIAFVLAAAAHGSIGLRAIAIEWLGWHRASAHRLMLGVAIAFSALGLLAVFAMVGS
jgi:fumarate reductase subunit C